MLRTTCIGALTMALAILSQANPQTPPVRFAVASIKPSDPAAPRGGRLAPPPIATRPGLLTARNATLKQLMEAAYSLGAYQISGGPGWIESARFDVDAKSDGPAAREALLGMLQSLLADRFRLAFHRETRDLAVFTLVVAKSGPKFHPATTAAGPRPRKVDRMAFPDLPSLAAYLTRLGADKPVLDRTGLKGAFDLELDLSGMAEEASRIAGGTPTNSAMFEATVNAVEDQLGLKLVPGKAPVEIFVIDRAEKAAAN
jgi:uncharacterized protein (TIGR03435 family)